MKTLDFPLLCWQLEDNAVLGLLIGFNIQLVADDVRNLKAGYIEYIEKKLKNEFYFDPALSNPKIKEITLSIRPHYREGARIFPINENVEVLIPAVYGDNDYNYYECFLPTLKRSFYFYNLDDLDKLVEHFARDILHDMTPNEIYGLLLPSKPWLEEFSVKVPKVKKKNGGILDFYSQFKTLNAIAEKLPYSKKEGSNLKPEIAWERGSVVEELQTLIIKEKGNVILVGKSGVGKSSIIIDTIKKINTLQKNNLERRQRNSFWRTTPSRMIAKAKYLGEWQMICEEIVEELHACNGILWVENLITLAMIGGQGPEDSIASFLSSFISTNNLQIIGELSEEQLELLRRILPSFAGLFKIIKVEEMDAQMSMKIFGYYNNYLQKHIAVEFTKSSLEISYILLDRFIRYESFPGKAIRFLSSVTSEAILFQKKTIEIDDVMQVFSDQSGIPEFLLRDDVLLDDEELKAYFEKRIKGQDHIIDQIISIIKVFKTGLNDPNKPVATMIFAGPTGVGKTATAKAISEYFFGMGQKTQPLIRIDMSEFQHSSQIYRLIGSEGKLIQQVREKPFCVLLLDEIEKANPVIFDALLTVLDEGILFDSAGRLTDFRNTIIIMTSNLGVSQNTSLGFRSYQGHDYEGSLKSFFRPEFFNRIDLALTFNPLDEETILSIAKKELSEIALRDGFKNKDIQLDFTDALLNYIAEEGFDQQYGARPLQREVERLVVAPLARFIINDIKFSGKTIQVDYQENKGIVLTVV